MNHVCVYVFQTQICVICDMSEVDPDALRQLFLICLFFLFFSQHRDTPENNPDTPFEFTPENLKVRKDLLFFHS